MTTNSRTEKWKGDENLTQYSLLTPFGWPRVKERSEILPLEERAHRTFGLSCHGKKSSQFGWPLVDFNSKAHMAILSIYGAPGMEIGKRPGASAPKALLGPWQPVTSDLGLKSLRKCYCDHFWEWGQTLPLSLFWVASSQPPPCPVISIWLDKHSRNFLHRSFQKTASHQI